MQRERRKWGESGEKMKEDEKRNEKKKRKEKGRNKTKEKAKRKREGEEIRCIRLCSSFLERERLPSI